MSEGSGKQEWYTFHRLAMPWRVGDEAEEGREKKSVMNEPLDNSTTQRSLCKMAGCFGLFWERYGFLMDCCLLGGGGGGRGGDEKARRKNRQKSDDGGEESGRR